MTILRSQSPSRRVSWLHKLFPTPRPLVKADQNKPAFYGRPGLESLESRLVLSSSVLGTETLVNSPAIVAKQQLAQDRSIAVNDTGTVIAAWSTPSGNDSSIVAQRIALDGTNTGDKFQVSKPVAGVTSLNAVVDATGSDRFVVAWQSAGTPLDKRGFGVFARVYPGGGQQPTAEFKVNATALGDQMNPSIAWLSADRFVVAWTGTYQDKYNLTSVARIFDVTGKAITQEIRLSNFGQGGQKTTVVTALPGGGFQAAWSGPGNGDNNGIFTQRFDKDGKRVGNEIRVNSTAAAVSGQQLSIAANAKQVIIVWTSAPGTLDNSGLGIVARRYDLNGVSQGAQFRVNETVKGDQSEPSIAFLPDILGPDDGGFVIAWQGVGAETVSGIYQREFGADGTPRFGERLVNKTADGLHENPTVRAQGPSGYIVAWDGKIQYKDTPLAPVKYYNQGIGIQQYGDPFMPKNSKEKASDVLFMGDSQNQVPLKTITLTNNTEQTVYPILRSANSAEDPDKKGSGLYDPIDPLNQEYRGYIGFADPKTGNTFVGLLKGQSVTIQVPLVFWDASRIYIATDASDMFPAIDKRPALAPPNQNSPNPFRYHEFMQDVPDGTEKTMRFTDTAQSGGIGRIMWYHGRGLKPIDGPRGLAEDIALDAPAQLTEFTIRDPILAKLNPHLQPVLDTLGPLINYDVSYVDSMDLPVAMEAQGVTIRDGKPVPVPNDFGWIGASLSVAEMQAALQAFTSNNTTPLPNQNGLGLYFDGKGYPEFFNPDDTLAGIKVPSGQNIFNLSPFSDKKSAYAFNDNQYMLTSGGTEPIRASIGGATDATTILKFPDPIAKAMLKNVVPNMTVSSGDGGIKANTIVLKVDPQGGTVTLNQPTTAGSKANPKLATFDFNRPKTDYATTKIKNLWYSWADYYVKNHVPVTGNSFAGKITALDNKLTFDTPLAKNALIEGMQVTGDGLPKGLNGNPNAPVTSILEIGLTDDKTKIAWVRLSKLALKNDTPPLPHVYAASYTFSVPETIRRSEEVKPFDLTFTDPAKALAFSKSIYLVMDAMATIETDKNKVDSVSQQIMTNIIGCNIGYLTNIGVAGDKANPAKYAGNAVIANVIRDTTKSVMRGVADFTKDQEKDGNWYPDPSLTGTTTGQKIGGKVADFNVYNINPFVWFVHKKLGLSGYGFSVDDDVADVGANVSTSLLVAIGGLKGLPNASEWSFGAQYGAQSVAGKPVVNSGSNDPVKNPDKIVLAVGPSDPNYAKAAEAYLKVWATDTANGVLGALVNGPGIAPGTRVSFRNGEVGKPGELSFNLDQKLDATMAKPGSFSFFGPTSGVGTVDRQKRSTIKIQDSKVFDQIMKMAGLPLPITTKTALPLPGGLFVAGSGVPKPTNTKPYTRIISIDPSTKSIEVDSVLTTYGDITFTFA